MILNAVSQIFYHILAHFIILNKALMIVRYVKYHYISHMPCIYLSIVYIHILTVMHHLLLLDVTTAKYTRL